MLLTLRLITTYIILFRKAKILQFREVVKFVVGLGSRQFCGLEPSGRKLARVAHL